MDKKLVETVLQKLKHELQTLAKEAQKKKEEKEKIKEHISKKKEQAESLEERSRRMKELKETVCGLLNELKKNEENAKELGKKYPYTLEQIEGKLDDLEKEEKELIRKINRAQGAEEVTASATKDRIQEEQEYEHKIHVTELLQKALEKTANDLRDEFTAEVKNQAEEIWSKYKGEKWKIDWDKEFVPEASPLHAPRKLLAYEMSGSERFLILLAIRIAFQKSLEHFNLLIIDEPCQHLDTVNGKKFRDTLLAIGEEKIKQSIIFTYNEDFLQGEWSKINKL